MGYYKDSEQNKKRKLQKGKQHVPWPNPSKIGFEHSALEEPVPELFTRPGDLPIQGDNNTLILLGRDRSGIGEQKTSKKTISASGFSDHMAAGMIDIVVGRGAPYPIKDLVAADLENNDGPARPFDLGPLYTTKTKIDSLKSATLYNFDKDGNQIGDFPHPAYAMDAARIYISQMTAVDEYFDLYKNTNFDGTDPDESSTGVIPTSGIVIKADKIRFHSRQDLKIVTGGKNEKYNSQGNYNLKPIGKIHLIPGNGLAGKQQPLVKGQNLVDALDDILTFLDKFVDNIDAYVKSQEQYNIILQNHVHQTAPVQSVALPNPLLLAAGAKLTLEHFSQNIVFGSLALKDQISKIRDNYLKDITSKDNTDKGSKYICSKYTTTG
jgi:hypothetical protein